MKQEVKPYTVLDGVFKKKKNISFFSPTFQGQKVSSRCEKKKKKKKKKKKNVFPRYIYTHTHTHTLLLLLNGGLVGTRFLCVRRLSFFRARGGGERGEKNGLGDDDDDFDDDDSRAPPPIFVVEVVP